MILAILYFIIISVRTSLCNNKLQKLEDALRETGETGDTGGKGDTGLTWSTVLRHYLTETKSKMSEISKRL